MMSLETILETHTGEMMTLLETAMSLNWIEGCSSKLERLWGPWSKI